ncbi:hypothetical protein BDN72DRAFT_864002 [Pluteus cervinus]|uniref:Uncharacterized protein n=1 Tax=Pluteus cervinus TaxID=181527 RepID=A0ACD3A5W3_9AGAR|nr:hypothetical protein BDN72DRAFT_864002 [Pluteus cervinus]
MDPPYAFQVTTPVVPRTTLLRIPTSTRQPTAPLTHIGAFPPPVDIEDGSRSADGGGEVDGEDGEDEDEAEAEEEAEDEIEDEEEDEEEEDEEEEDEEEQEQEQGKGKGKGKGTGKGKGKGKGEDKEDEEEDDEDEDGVVGPRAASTSSSTIRSPTITMPKTLPLTQTPPVMTRLLHGVRDKSRDLHWFQCKTPSPLRSPPNSKFFPKVQTGDLFVHWVGPKVQCQVWEATVMEQNVTWVALKWGHAFTQAKFAGCHFVITLNGKPSAVEKSTWEKTYRRRDSPII